MTTWTEPIFSRAALISVALLLISFEAQAQEERCKELGASCLCSETLDGPETAVSGRINGGHDFASSPDAKECWGRGGDFLNFDTSQTQSIVPVTGWGDARFALRRNSGFMWLYGKRPQALTSNDRSVCYRYYKQVDADYGGVGGPGGACPGTTWRSKIIQTDMGGQQMQVEERDSAGCPPIGQHNPIVISIDNGPGEGNYSFSPPIDFGSCKSAPCRIELCVDGNLKAGTNITYRSKIVPVATGVEHVAKSPVVSPGPPGNQFLWGGDIFHSGPGSGQHGYFMHAVWQSSNQWIGPAREIEGGAGSPSPPPPPIQPAAPFLLE